ncbi:MAG TPA: PEP-CTERM sorting domain-containing protein [Cellvibrio sp.]|nr:PEP-CTERM sorting domain-containing protein [Cellvibrio sp.]
MNQVLCKKFSWALLLSCLSSFAAAGVVNFDDLSGDPAQQITDGYQAFNWNAIGSVSSDDIPGSGFAAGVTSGNNAAYNFDGAWTWVDLSVAGTFDFIGAFFSAGWAEQEISFEGWLDGALVYASAESQVISTAQPLWVQLDWVGIDQLFIYTSYADVGLGHWVMDDFTVNINRTSVPESSGVVLMLMGLLGVSLLRRRI